MWQLILPLLKPLAARQLGSDRVMVFVSKLAVPDTGHQRCVGACNYVYKGKVTIICGIACVNLHFARYSQAWATTASQQERGKGLLLEGMLIEHCSTHIYGSK